MLPEEERVLEAAVTGFNETQICLRTLMDRHKMSYRAMNDVIDFVRSRFDMDGIKSITDVIERSTTVDIRMENICCHCHGPVVDHVCDDDSW